MLIEKRSNISGKINTREIPVTQEQLNAWGNGALIQKAMPNLSPDDREFLMSGITPEEWNELFQEEIAADAKADSADIVSEIERKDDV